MTLIMPEPNAALSDLRNVAREFAEASRASNTVRAYESDLRDFGTWTAARALSSLPATAETVSIYVADLASRVKPSTIQRRLASIAVAHRNAGYETPTAHGVVKSVLQGIRRSKGSQPARKDALTVDDLRSMVAAIPSLTKTQALRDRAVLLLGFASAMRRSELVSLNVDDLSFEREGLVLTLEHSKTNQVGDAERIAVVYGSDVDTCPVRTLQAWIELAGITEGALFRFVDRHGSVRASRMQGRVVAAIVQRAASAVGLAGNFGGHSLRAGFATAAARAGKSSIAIRQQTRHKSDAMLQRYVREGSIFANHAGVGLGL